MKQRRIVYHNFSAGMFSMVKSVLSAIREAERVGLSPHVVVEGTPYREDGYQENAWNRFWHPIGDPSVPCVDEVRISGHPGFPTNDTWFHLRQPTNDLWRKYIRPNQQVQQLIDNNSHLVRRVGVHYRATDKHHECTRIPVEDYAKALISLSASISSGTYYLATDSQAAVQEFRRLTPDLGALLADVERSKDMTSGYGTHFTIKDRGRAGMEAILDAYLLSRCDFLVCGASNLSECVTYLHPGILLVSLR